MPPGCFTPHWPVKFDTRQPRTLKCGELIMFYKICKFGSTKIRDDIILMSIQITKPKFGPSQNQINYISQGAKQQKHVKLVMGLQALLQIFLYRIPSDNACRLYKIDVEHLSAIAFFKYDVMKATLLSLSSVRLQNTKLWISPFCENKFHHKK